ncbi:GntR family transcriptional regulator [Tepidibacillus marianensis]|uniref:GntR family transcriptional regulator n=1 Tax=Tepidibacillus marianensis TaxID=3131995 RepID=UPI0030D10C26
MAFSKIKQPKSFTQIAYTEIKNAMINHSIAPGQTIFERDLSEKLGISRTPVREAIQQLEMEGWVKSIPRKGIYVNDISIKDVEEVLQLRKANEVLVLELVTSRITEEEISTLEEMYITQREISDIRSFISSDTNFHIYLAELSGNKRLVQLMKTLSDQIHWFGIQALYQLGRSDKALKEHGQIVEAIKNKNMDQARGAILEHIEKTGVAILSSLNKLGEENL